jgi:DNA replicative helicase MCM subunit Mcm2 (Cdc46/Mcm family)
MDVETRNLSDQFSLFLQEYYSLNKPFQETCWDKNEEIQSSVLRKAKRITIDFNAIEEFDTKNDAQLTKTLLESKDATLVTLLMEFEQKLNDIDRGLNTPMDCEAKELTQEDAKKIKKENWLRLGIKNLPNTYKIGEIINEKTIGKLVQIEGVITNIGIPFVASIQKTFECKRCERRVTVDYTPFGRKIHNKMYCPNCRAERDFEELKDFDISREFQILTISEAVQSSLPIQIAILLHEDLIDNPIPEKRRFIAGMKVIIDGILLERRHQGTNIKKPYIDSLFWKTETEEIRFTDDDIKKFKKASKDEKLIDKLIQSYSPSIYGYEDVKKGLILQLVGGVTKYSEKDKKMNRGNIHILLIGDPSTSKTTLSLFNFNYFPKTYYTVCSEATSAGLSVAMLKDPETDSWYISAGVLVVGSGGLCILDEIDKATPDDIKSLDTVMSLQKLPVSKASINITLPAETSVLAIANPKKSRWDAMLDLKDQINLSEVTLSRFDLKFCFTDKPNAEIDSKIADKMGNITEKKTPFTPEFLVKYLMYAKSTKPKVNKKTFEKLKKFYVEMRQKTVDKVGILVITSRQFEGLLRFAEAFAKLRLAEETNDKDADNAIESFKGFLRSFGFDYETGELDIDKAEGRTSAQSRVVARDLIEIYNDLKNIFGEKIPMSDFIESCENEGIKRAEERVRKAIREGEFFEPESGFISRA